MSHIIKKVKKKKKRGGRIECYTIDFRSLHSCLIWATAAAAAADWWLVVLPVLLTLIEADREVGIDLSLAMLCCLLAMPLILLLLGFLRAPKQGIIINKIKWEESVTKKKLTTIRGWIYIKERKIPFWIPFFSYVFMFKWCHLPFIFKCFSSYRASFSQVPSVVLYNYLLGV